LKLRIAERLVGAIRCCARVTPVITLADAVEIARADFIKEGDPWPDDVTFQQNLTTDSVIVDGAMRGGATIYKIDVRTGKIINKWVAPL